MTHARVAEGQKIILYRDRQDAVVVVDVLGLAVEDLLKELEHDWLLWPGVATRVGMWPVTEGLWVWEGLIEAVPGGTELIGHFRDIRQDEIDQLYTGDLR